MFKVCIKKRIFTNKKYHTDLISLDVEFYLDGGFQINGFNGNYSEIIAVVHSSLRDENNIDSFGMFDESDSAFTDSIESFLESEYRKWKINSICSEDDLNKNEIN